MVDLAEAHTRVYEVALLLRADQTFFNVDDIIKAYRSYCNTEIDYEKFGFLSLEEFLEYGDAVYPKRIFSAPLDIPGYFICLLKKNYTFVNKLNAVTVPVYLDNEDLPEIAAMPIKTEPEDDPPPQELPVQDRPDSIPPPASPDKEPEVALPPHEQTGQDRRDSIPASAAADKERSSSNSEESIEDAMSSYNPDHFFLKLNMKRVMLDCLKRAEWVTLAEVSEAYSKVYATKFEEDCTVVGCFDTDGLVEMCKGEVIIRQNEDNLWICELPGEKVRVQKKREVRNFLTYEPEKERCSVSRSPSPAKESRRKKNRRNRSNSKRSLSKEKKKEQSPARWEHDRFRDYSPVRRGRVEKKRT